MSEEDNSQYASGPQYRLVSPVALLSISGIGLCLLLIGQGYSVVEPLGFLAWALGATGQGLFAAIRHNRMRRAGTGPVLPVATGAAALAAATFHGVGAYPPLFVLNFVELLVPLLFGFWIGRTCGNAALTANVPQAPAGPPAVPARSFWIVLIVLQCASFGLMFPILTENAVAGLGGLWGPLTESGWIMLSAAVLCVRITNYVFRVA